MDGVANLSKSKKIELFTETARRRGLAPRIIEKDFWVCWSLKILFSLPKLQEAFIFKGGTSLSKGFNLISRFSEDVDVSIKRDVLGFSGSKDPESQPSKNQQRKSIEALRDKCREFVAEIVFPELEAVIKSSLTFKEKQWKLSIDRDDQNTILFAYPSALSTDGEVLDRYIEPVIRIEFGAGSDNFPIGPQKIASYASEEFPHLFSAPYCLVTLLEPVRTFWEKVTLVHAEHHRPLTSATPPRISRHYYDLFALSTSETGKRFHEDIAMLSRVAQHKSVFFASGWAHYETAKPGSIKLVPVKDRIRDLTRDYDLMQEMFFGEAPAFSMIMAEMQRLEGLVNQRES